MGKHCELCGRAPTTYDASCMRPSIRGHRAAAAVCRTRTEIETQWGQPGLRGSVAPRRDAQAGEDLDLGARVLGAARCERVRAGRMRRIRHRDLAAERDADPDVEPQPA